MVAEAQVLVKPSDYLGVEWTPDGTQVICYEGYGGKLHNFDAESWTFKHTCAKRFPIRAIACARDGTSLAGIGRGKLMMFDTHSGKKVWRVTGQPEPKYPGLSWSADGKVLGSSYGDSVRLGNPKDGKKIAFYIGDSEQYQDESNDGIAQIAFSYDGKLLAGGSQYSIFFWDLLTKEKIATLPGFGSVFLRPLAFHPTQKLVATRRLKEPIKVWSYDY